jgi:DUF1680 family protein
MTSDGSISRQEWFGTACCPPNFARLIQSLDQYIWAQSSDTAYVNLYVGSQARLDLGDQRVVLHMDTDAPWGGHSRITVASGRSRFDLKLRIPSWAASFSLRINGAPFDAQLDKGYAVISRTWSEGDTVELDFTITTKRIWANPKVSDAADKVALQRGPFVYCLEGVDHQLDIAQLSLPRSAKVQAVWTHDRTLVVLEAEGFADAAGSDDLYGQSPPRHLTAALRAVPYFSWGNRGTSTMQVWIRDSAG